MTQRYSVLQKKLKELESILNDVFHLNPLDRNLYAPDDIEQRLEFLKTLLSAEITSSPEKPHHLQHIGRRLSDLETIFREWQHLETTTTKPLYDHHVETVSTCSCTESCLNDDGEAAFEVGSWGFEDKENMDVGFIERNDEKEVGEEVSISEMKTVEKGSVGDGGLGWRICGSFGVGVVIGMSLMGSTMVNLCECFPYGKRIMYCYTPT